MRYSLITAHSHADQPLPLLLPPPPPHTLNPPLPPHRTSITTPCIALRLMPIRRPRSPHSLLPPPPLPHAATLTPPPPVTPLPLPTRPEEPAEAPPKNHLNIIILTDSVLLPVSVVAAAAEGPAGVSPSPLLLLNRCPPPHNRDTPGVPLRTMKKRRSPPSPIPIFPRL